MNNPKYVWYITGALMAYQAPQILQTLEVGLGKPKAIVVSESALNFTSTTALQAIGHTRVVIDSWHSFQESGISHVDLIDPDSVALCYPATLNTISRFTNGDCSSPFLLALQCSKANIVFAPALPPGGLDSIAFQRFKDLVSEHYHLHLLPTVPIKSAASSHVVAQGIPNARYVVDLVKEIVLQT